MGDVGAGDSSIDGGESGEHWPKNASSFDEAEAPLPDPQSSTLQQHGHCAASTSERRDSTPHDENSPARRIFGGKSSGDDARNDGGAPFAPLVDSDPSLSYAAFPLLSRSPANRFALQSRILGTKEHLGDQGAHYSDRHSTYDLERHRASLPPHLRRSGSPPAVAVAGTSRSSATRAEDAVPETLRRDGSGDSIVWNGVFSTSMRLRPSMSIFQDGARMAPVHESGSDNLATWRENALSHGLGEDGEEDGSSVPEMKAVALQGVRGTSSDCDEAVGAGGGVRHRRGYGAWLPGSGHDERDDLSAQADARFRAPPAIATAAGKRLTAGADSPRGEACEDPLQQEPTQRLYEESAGVARTPCAQGKSAAWREMAGPGLAQRWTARWEDSQRLHVGPRASDRPAISFGSRPGETIVRHRSSAHPSERLLSVHAPATSGPSSYRSAVAPDERALRADRRAWEAGGPAVQPERRGEASSLVEHSALEHAERAPGASLAERRSVSQPGLGLFACSGVVTCDTSGPAEAEAVHLPAQNMVGVPLPPQRRQSSDSALLHARKKQRFAEERETRDLPPPHGLAFLRGSSPCDHVFRSSHSEAHADRLGRHDSDEHARAYTRFLELAERSARSYAGNRAVPDLLVPSASQGEQHGVQSSLFQVPSIDGYCAPQPALFTDSVSRESAPSRLATRMLGSSPYGLSRAPFAPIWGGADARVRESTSAFSRPHTDGEALRHDRGRAGTSAASAAAAPESANGRKRLRAQIHDALRESIASSIIPCRKFIPLFDIDDDDGGPQSEHHASHGAAPPPPTALCERKSALDRIVSPASALEPGNAGDVRRSDGESRCASRGAQELTGVLFLPTISQRAVAASGDTAGRVSLALTLGDFIASGYSDILKLRSPQDRRIPVYMSPFASLCDLVERVGARGLHGRLPDHARGPLAPPDNVAHLCTADGLIRGIDVVRLLREAGRAVSLVCVGSSDAENVVKKRWWNADAEVDDGAASPPARACQPSTAACAAEASGSGHRAEASSKCDDRVPLGADKSKAAKKYRSGKALIELPADLFDRRVIARWPGSLTKAWRHRKSDPSRYYYYFLDPGMVRVRGKPDSSELSAWKERFIALVRAGWRFPKSNDADGKATWGVFAAEFPQRTGFDCKKYITKQMCDIWMNECGHSDLSGDEKAVLPQARLSAAWATERVRAIESKVDSLVNGAASAAAAEPSRSPTPSEVPSRSPAPSEAPSSEHHRRASTSSSPSRCEVKRTAGSCGRSARGAAAAAASCAVKRPRSAPSLPVNPSGCARCEYFTRRSRAEKAHFAYRPPGSSVPGRVRSSDSAPASAEGAALGRGAKAAAAFEADACGTSRIPKRRVGAQSVVPFMPDAHQYRVMKERRDIVAVRKSPIHGRGLFARKDLEAGELVQEYVGEIISNEVGELRGMEYERIGRGCYMFRISETHIIDATRKGGPARFINHSCDPNCISRIVSIQGEKKILFYTQKSIKAGQEITYDYHFESESGKIMCYCGSSKCRSWMN